MRRQLLLIGFVVCVLPAVVLAQTALVPKPPLTAKDAERGLQLYNTLWQVRNSITDFRAPVEPFKVIGNLYFVGVADGNGFLLTSPQGHILFGTGFNSTQEAIANNIQKLGFKLTDIKAIVINHQHLIQAGGAAYFRRKTGAQVMAGFADIPYLEHAGSLPGAPAGVDTRPRAKLSDNPFGGFRGPDSMYTRLPDGTNYEAVRVDRALFDGDVIRVGPSSVTAYLMPTHTLGSTTFVFTVREGNRDYRVIQYCCWEHPDDYSRSPTISQATFVHMMETLRKLMPVDVYLESGTYAWGGIINQPSGTWEERMARLRANPKLFIDREVFRAITAAREVDFSERMAKADAANPHLR